MHYNYRKIFFHHKSIACLFCLGVSILAVFAGGLIYIFLRPEEAKFIHLIRFAGFNNWVEFVRGNTNQDFPNWFIYSLPDGLWAFAYAMLITVIWAHKQSGIKFFWLGTIPLLVFGFEFLQYLNLISGTFSGQDLLFGTLGIISGIVIGLLTIKLKNNEKIYV